MVACSVQSPFGEVDLSQLSLPSENYELARGGSGGKIILNVCRSVVHSATNCPYHAAACFVNTKNGQVTHESLGEAQGGPMIDANDGSVFLDYKLGSICQEPASNKSHIETRINFECTNDTDTLPELVDNSDCFYTFRWRHAASCPIKKVEHSGCTVTNPATGFTYNLTSLNKAESDYSWKGVYHHIKGAFRFNICGKLVKSKCGDGAGMCSDNGTNYGQANSDLIIEDGQLYLNYSNGELCEDGQRKVTQINFNCPYIRNFSSSGNFELSSARRYNVEQHTRCFTQVNFPTELACEHQV